MVMMLFSLILFVVSVGCAVGLAVKATRTRRRERLDENARTAFVVPKVYEVRTSTPAAIQPLKYNVVLSPAAAPIAADDTTTQMLLMSTMTAPTHHSAPVEHHSTSHDCGSSYSHSHDTSFSHSHDCGSFGGHH